MTAAPRRSTPRRSTRRSGTVPHCPTSIRTSTARLVSFLQGAGHRSVRQHRAVGSDISHDQFGDRSTPTPRACSRVARSRSGHCPSRLVVRSRTTARVAPTSPWVPTAPSESPARTQGAPQSPSKVTRRSPERSFRRATVVPPVYSTSTSGSVATAPPLATYSVEAWVKTTSTTGGMIAGDGLWQTNDSQIENRVLYFDTSGDLHFGAYNNGPTDAGLEVGDRQPDPVQRRQLALRRRHPRCERGRRSTSTAYRSQATRRWSTPRATSVTGGWAATASPAGRQHRPTATWPDRSPMSRSTRPHCRRPRCSRTSTEVQPVHAGRCIHVALHCPVVRLRRIKLNRHRRRHQRATAGTSVTAARS